MLVAPEPDKQQPHADDEVYVVLEGRGALNVEGEAIPVVEGQAIFVPAGADHQFTAYEGLSVLVIFARASAASAPAQVARPLNPATRPWKPAVGIRVRTDAAARLFSETPCENDEQGEP